MKIILAGGKGFLGNALEEYFTKKGHEVWVLTRSPQRINEIKWDARTLGEWSKSIENTDVLINLTGKSVDCRYTQANKDEILNSRINSTKVLQLALNTCQNPPKLWINSSSATIYIHNESEFMTESAGIIGDDFSMGVCKQWENAFFNDGRSNLRKVALRTSIVLGNGGGAFPKLKWITKIGLGGKQGKGSQKVSWIHIEDFCRAVDFIISNSEIKGVINVTAPNPIFNSKFMSILRNTLKVPFGIPSPVFLLEIGAFFLRTQTELLLKSRNVYPEILLKKGFKFKYPDVNIAFSELVKPHLEN